MRICTYNSGRKLKVKLTMVQLPNIYNIHNAAYVKIQFKGNVFIFINLHGMTKTRCCIEF